MGGLSMLLLAGEHALTAQEVRNTLLSLIVSPQFKESSEEEYMTSGKGNLRYILSNLRWDWSVSPVTWVLYSNRERRGWAQFLYRFNINSANWIFDQIRQVCPLRRYCHRQKGWNTVTVLTNGWFASFFGQGFHMLVQFLTQQWPWH